MTVLEAEEEDEAVLEVEELAVFEGEDEAVLVQSILVLNHYPWGT